MEEEMAKNNGSGGTGLWKRAFFSSPDIFSIFPGDSVI